MTTQVQGQSLTFVQDHSDSTFSKLRFLKKNARPFEVKFHMERPSDVGIKIYSNIPGNMTKMASRHI